MVTAKPVLVLDKQLESMLNGTSFFSKMITAQRSMVNHVSLVSHRHVFFFVEQTSTESSLALRAMVQLPCRSFGHVSLGVNTSLMQSIRLTSKSEMALLA